MSGRRRESDEDLPDLDEGEHIQDVSDLSDLIGDERIKRERFDDETS